MPWQDPLPGVAANSVMIHIAIGTKAQFIKMAPIIARLQEKNLPFRLIDLGQHALITQHLRDEFDLPEPEVSLSSGKNVSGFWQGIGWLLRIVKKSFSRTWVRSFVFGGREGTCLIHGDTASTLLGLFLAKRAGLRVAHVEAGLRSFCLREPFPEEIVRRIAMRYSDILFAPSIWAQKNLEACGYAKKTVLLSANTSLEACRYSLKKSVDAGVAVERYCVVTVHRMENIFCRRRLRLLVDLFCRISKTLPVVFVQHPPTLRRLEKWGLNRKLKECNNIHFHQILSHAHFIALLKGSEYVVTDGGSIQEESFYLDKPCLLLRNVTERQEGVGENVFISGLNTDRIDEFLKRYQHLRRKDPVNTDCSPSSEILDYLLF